MKKPPSLQLETVAKEMPKFFVGTSTDHTDCDDANEI